MNEHHSHFRRLIEHEDNLRDRRLNWFLTSQGFIVAALGLVADADGAVNHTFELLLCAMGLLVSLSFLVLFKEGTIAMTQIKQDAESIKKTSPEATPEEMAAERIAFFHNDDPSIWTKFHFLVPWKIMPPMMALFWAVGLYTRCCSCLAG